MLIPQSFMESAQYIGVFKILAILLTFGALAALILTKQEVNSRLSTVVGALLAVYGLLMVSVWFVNYMVIGTGLIALAGVVLIFRTSIGKFIYLIAVLFISIFASIEYGANSREFFGSVTFLYILGAGLLFYVHDNTPELVYEYDEQEVSVSSEKIRMENARLREKAENATRIDPDNIQIFVRGFAIGLFLLMILFWVIRLIA